jgi:hypothetical protein
MEEAARRLEAAMGGGGGGGGGGGEGGGGGDGGGGGGGGGRKRDKALVDFEKWLDGVLDEPVGKLDRRRTGAVGSMGRKSKSANSLVAGGTRVGRFAGLGRKISKGKQVRSKHVTCALPAAFGG